MKRFFLVVVCLAVLSLIPLTGFFISRSYRAPKNIDLDAGRALLQSYDDVNVDTVQQKVAQVEQQRLEKLAQESRALKTQEIINLIQAGKLTYRKALADLYIAGDSLMAGLDVYGILNASHIFAEVSASLSHLEKNLPAIAAKNPPILLLHYGLVVACAGQECHTDDAEEDHCTGEAPCCLFDEVGCLGSAKDLVVVGVICS